MKKKSLTPIGLLLIVSSVIIMASTLLPRLSQAGEKAGNEFLMAAHYGTYSGTDYCNPDWKLKVGETGRYNTHILRFQMNPQNPSAGEDIEVTVVFTTDISPSGNAVCSQLWGDWCPNESLGQHWYSRGQMQGEIVETYRFRAPNDSGNYRIRWFNSDTNYPNIDFYGAPSESHPEWAYSYPHNWMELQFATNTQNWTLVYSEDFSQNPAWTTNNGTNYYWDSTNKTYHINFVRHSGEYAVKQLPSSLISEAGSFKLEYDINATQVDWAAHIPFGVFDSDFNTAQKSCVWFMLGHDSATGYCAGILAYDTTNTGYSDYQGKVYNLNTWYTVTFIYDSIGHQITGQLKRKSDGVIVNSYNISNVGAFAPMQYVGSSTIGQDLYGATRAYADIDNIKYYTIGSFTVFPSSHDFGSLKCELETDTPQTFTLTNTGASNITINTISLSGANSSEFSIKNDNCSGQTISSSGTATFDVVFSPQTAGNKTASISIASNDPDSPITIPLTGKGVLTTVVRVDKALSVFIIGNNVTFGADTYGARDKDLTYKWDLDNDGEKDNSESSTPSKSWTLDGTYVVGVEVTDSVSEEKATNWSYVTIDKEKAPNQPTILNPAIDIFKAVDMTDIDAKFYDSNGITEFTFDPNKKDNGLIIITHGLTASAIDPPWLKEMGKDIIDRLSIVEKKNLPNIALYDWEELSDPDKVAGSSLDPLASQDIKDITPDFLQIMPYGLAEGLILADWIKTQEGLGNINTAQPIHIIGHSAGGFVAGNCAEALPSKIRQITLLDTPVPLMNKAFLDNNGKIDYYISCWGTECLSWIFFPPQQIHGTALSGPFTHSYAHDWYKDTCSDATIHDGFYYSPWLGNAFPSFAGQSLVQGIQTMSSVSGTPVSVFETFGNVSLTSGVYTITEGAGDAGIFKTINFPSGAQSINFRYKFTSAGDGDFLSVHIKDTTNHDTLLYVGPELTISRADYIDGEAPIGSLAGKTGQIIFKLISRGNPNAVLSLDSIQLLGENVLPDLTITASISGGHGSVSPETQDIPSGESATINITPDAGYHITSITDNDSSVTITNPYIITSVTAAHTVVITFVVDTTPILAVTPDNQDVASTAGTTTFAVSNTGTGTMNWTAAVNTGSEWLSITSGSSGTNSGTITVDFTQNTVAVARTGTITVTATGATGSPKDITVTQEAAASSGGGGGGGGGGGPVGPLAAGISALLSWWKHRKQR